MKNKILLVLFGFVLGILASLVAYLLFKKLLKDEDPKTDIVHIEVFNKEESFESKSHNFLNAVSVFGDTINFIDLPIESYEKLELNGIYLVQIKLSVPNHPKNNGWYDLVQIF